MIRFFDILISFLGLVILSPLFILLAFIVKLDSKGPVLFRQQRVGKNGIDFELLKFRSMHVNSQRKGLLTVGNFDPRLTQSGYHMRKFKLDELPQLINVLRGDMSLVGPRPEVRKYVDLYSAEQKMILSVKPGITDYASIMYANENEILEGAENPEKRYIEDIMPHKIELNMKFIQNPSICQYFLVLSLTVFRIFIRRGNLIK